MADVRNVREIEPQVRLEWTAVQLIMQQRHRSISLVRNEEYVGGGSHIVRPHHGVATGEVNRAGAASNVGNLAQVYALGQIADGKDKGEVGIDNRVLWIMPLAEELKPAQIVRGKIRKRHRKKRILLHAMCSDLDRFT